MTNWTCIYRKQHPIKTIQNILSANKTLTEEITRRVQNRCKSKLFKSQNIFSGYKENSHTKLPNIWNQIHIPKVNEGSKKKSKWKLKIILNYMKKERIKHSKMQLKQHLKCTIHQKTGIWDHWSKFKKLEKGQIKLIKH